MKKVTMAAASMITGMVVGGAVGMVVGGKSDTRRAMKKTAKAARAVGDVVGNRIHMK